MVIGESRDDLCLNGRDAEGLCYILGHIEDHAEHGNEK